MLRLSLRRPGKVCYSLGSYGQQDPGLECYGLRCLGLQQTSYAVVWKGKRRHGSPRSGWRNKLMNVWFGVRRWAVVRLGKAGVAEVWHASLWLAK